MPRTRKSPRKNKSAKTPSPSAAGKRNLNRSPKGNHIPKGSVRKLAARASVMRIQYNGERASDIKRNGKKLIQQENMIDFIDGYVDEILGHIVERSEVSAQYGNRKTVKERDVINVVTAMGDNVAYAESVGSSILRNRCHQKRRKRKPKVENQTKKEVKA